MATLADILRQTGYAQGGTLATPAPVNSPMTKVLSDHIASLPQKFEENQANQMNLLSQAFPGNTYESMMTQGDPKALAELGMQAPFNAITAFHGTPHKILGKFDISKVGTGEGAQAYGHGMYFAENPAVAGEYARALAEKPKDVINGYINYSAKYGRPKGEGNTSLGYLQSQGFPIENAPLLDKIIAGANVDKQGNVNFSSSAIKELSNLESAMASKGNLYKVNIPDADIPNMLDWDKPLNQQPKNVKEYFTKRGYTNDNWSASSFIKNEGDPAEVSAILHEAGIPGIRYLDQGSRNTGKGSSNFVVFDPSTVKILEENSKPLSRKELIEQQVNKVIE